MILPNQSLVAVIWEDARSSSTDVYTATDLPHEPILICTVGWEIRNDERGISVVNEYCGDLDYRGHTFVPRALVKDVKILKKAKIKKEKGHETRVARPGSGS